jgi:hypothetical protein
MDQQVKSRLSDLGRAIVDQQKARIIVKPYEEKSGFWFGGGNLVEDAEGAMHLVGRYRNAGDSTTGLGKGIRGLELAIYSSADRGRTWNKTVSFSKDRLSRKSGEVVSIEGAALNIHNGRYELFVSTEKNSISYPKELSSFQKPGTGVWSIDRMEAGTITGLGKAKVTPLVAGDSPEHLHVKDPVVHTAGDGSTMLVFCTHPFGWSSSNSAYCVRPAGASRFGKPDFTFFPRGNTWDVAVSRISDILTISRDVSGLDETFQLVFYDGAECIRYHEENPTAVKRPRGYSCEEIGGLAAAADDRLDRIERLSVLTPFFLSPWGTGSSRYVHTLAATEGIYATWQQSQADGSQPLVQNFVNWDRVKTILRGTK